MTVWIDIENPPQVQFLVPLATAFERAGVGCLITARDDGMTYDLLRGRGVSFHPVGEAFGKGKLQKVRGVVARARALVRLVRRQPTPVALVSTSRAAALAARWLGVPSFVVCDYEHANLSLFRLAGSHLIHPDVIDSEFLLRKGFRSERLIPFSGLKEDITFAGFDVESVPNHRFDVDERLVRVLFRPPAENSHYYASESGRLALQLLEYFAAERSAVIIFSPRYSHQSAYLSRFSWATPPIPLEKPIPFVSLLKGVDLVVSSGGTMLREAACLGVPAYSIFQSELGAVDRYLQAAGRLECVSSPEEFDRVRLTRLTTRAPRLHHPGVPEGLVQAVLARSVPA